MKNKSLKIYVDNSFSGRSDGSAASPLKTLESAQNAVRKLRAAQAGRPVEILVAPGLYRLEKTLSFGPSDGGTQKAPVTWTGYGGCPVLSGAKVIQGWAKGTINGRDCWQTVVPEVKKGTWWFTQLFVNGHRRMRARLPKKGFYRFAGVPKHESEKDKGDFFQAAMSAYFTKNEVLSFRNLADIEVIVPDHWYENHLRIKSVDEKKRIIHFSTRGLSRFSRDETGLHTRFRLDHVMEACTDPGDWYLDRRSGKLYYIPVPGESIEETVIEAPHLDQLLDIRGSITSTSRRVKHLRFQFLDFRHTEFELPPSNPGAGQAAFNIPGAVRLTGAENCALYACSVSRTAGWGIEVMNGCSGNRIVACSVSDLGAGGIKVAGDTGINRSWISAFKDMDCRKLGWDTRFTHKSMPFSELRKAKPSATTISDCTVDDGGKIFHSAIGIWLGDASHNNIIHNRISNFNYTGLSCGWNWGYMPSATCCNRIENNLIFNIGLGMLSDMGAIYTLGRQAASTVRRNVIRNVRSNGYGGWGIYTDEGTSWMLVEENIVFDTKCGGFHQHYGRDNLVRRNIFASSLENQLAVTRQDICRPARFMQNIAQGAGNGALWSGFWTGGWEKLICDRNIYAPEPGRTPFFGKKMWKEWQRSGRDRKGRLCGTSVIGPDGTQLTPNGGKLLKTAGLSHELFTDILSAAGPRYRGVLPASIDRIPKPIEEKRPVVEPCLWPWKAEWPGKHEWATTMAASVDVAAGEPQTISLTLENRGSRQANGRYTIRVKPAGAARIAGKDSINVKLEPGEKTAMETSVIPTGSHKSFCVEAVPSGKWLWDTALFFQVREEPA